MSFTTEACKSVYEALKAEAEPIWRFFLQICEVPHKSFNSEPIVAFLLKLADEHGIEHDRDELGNIILRVPATPGYEHVPGICIQGHSDMVGVHADGVEHNWETDAIKPRIDGDWLYATGTTLGADNGMGLAAGFAALTDPTLKHGPLEALFTVDEEVGLIGAMGIKPDFVRSKYLINADSEEEDALCVGCAGGFANTFSIKVERAAVEGQLVSVKVSGLAGGHTGCDAAEERGNALKFMARMVLTAESDAKLVSIDGGFAHNAIPADCTAVLCIPADQRAAFETSVKATFADLKAEFSLTDPHMTLAIGTSASELPSMTAESTLNVLAYMATMPFGPFRRAQADHSLVETSYASTKATTTAEKVEILGSGRSSNTTQLHWLYKEIAIRAAMNPAYECSEKMQGYPAWTPNFESPLLKTMIDIHTKTLGVKPHVYAIHAGLEAAVIGDLTATELDMISIGPQIEAPHSPTERVGINSVTKFWKLLRASIESIAENA
jgi:dipeptidase D